jgi:hypothetical protein
MPAMGWTTLPDGKAKIDVRGFIAEMERELRGGTDEVNRDRILATLWRWQSDAMLDQPSRARARALAAEFEGLDEDPVYLIGYATAVKR